MSDTLANRAPRRRILTGFLSWDRTNWFIVGTGLLLFFGQTVLLGAKGPFYLGSNVDPDYAYLLNALNIARGLPPIHVDHPGTLVQLLGAPMIWAIHLSGPNPDLVDDVVRHPEHFLTVMSWIFFGIYAAVLSLSALVVRAATKSVFAAFAVMLTPVLSHTIAAHCAVMSPEAVLPSLSICFGLVLFAALRTPEGGRSGLVALAFGFVAGLILATKVTGAPLLLLPLFVLVGWRTWGIYGGATLGTAAVFTIPAWPRFVYMFDWFKLVATHTGRYGTGDAGVLDGNYGRTVALLFASEPVMVGTIILSLVAIIIDSRRNDGQPAIRRALVGLNVVQIAAVLLVAKHPSYITTLYNYYWNDHYLIPALGLVGVMFGLTWMLLSPLLLPARFSRPVILVVLVLFGLGQWATLHAVYGTLVRDRDQQLEVDNYARKNFPGATIGYFYRSSSVPYALYFGDSAAGDHYQHKIASVYPHALHYSIFAKAFLTVVPGENETTILLQGSPRMYQNYVAAQFPQKARKLFGNEIEALYEIELR